MNNLLQNFTSTINPQLSYTSKLNYKKLYFEMRDNVRIFLKEVQKQITKIMKSHKNQKQQIMKMMINMQHKIRNFESNEEKTIHNNDLTISSIQQKRRENNGSANSQLQSSLLNLIPSFKVSNQMEINKLNNHTNNKGSQKSFFEGIENLKLKGEESRHKIQKLLSNHKESASKQNKIQKPIRKTAKRSELTSNFSNKSKQNIQDKIFSINKHKKMEVDFVLHNIRKSMGTISPKTNQFNSTNENMKLKSILKNSNYPCNHKQNVKDSFSQYHKIVPE